MGTSFFTRFVLYKTTMKVQSQGGAGKNWVKKKEPQAKTYLISTLLSLLLLLFKWQKYL